MYIIPNPQNIGTKVSQKLKEVTQASSSTEDAMTQLRFLSSDESAIKTVCGLSLDAPLPEVNEGTFSYLRAREKNHKAWVHFALGCYEESKNAFLQAIDMLENNTSGKQITLPCVGSDCTASSERRSFQQQLRARLTIQCNLLISTTACTDDLGSILNELSASRLKKSMYNLYLEDPQWLGRSGVPRLTAALVATLLPCAKDRRLSLSEKQRIRELIEMCFETCKTYGRDPDDVWYLYILAAESVLHEHDDKELRLEQLPKELRWKRITEQLQQPGSLWATQERQSRAHRVVHWLRESVYRSNQSKVELNGGLEKAEEVLSYLMSLAQ